MKRSREEESPAERAEQDRIRRALLQPQGRENLSCRVNHAGLLQSPFLLTRPDRCKGEGATCQSHGSGACQPRCV